MRPESYYHFVLGRVQREALYRKRIKKMQRNIIKRINQDPDKKNKKSSFIVTDYFKNSFFNLDKKCLTNIENISGGNVREILWNIYNTYTGNTYYNHYIINRGRGIKHRKNASRYHFLDSLVVGQGKHHTATKTRILNIFNLSEENNNKSLLIGYLILLKLSIYNKKVGAVSLASMGLLLDHETNIISDALELLNSEHFFRYTNKNKDFIITNRLKINGYIDLITTPAYIDNMALVTPLPFDIASTMKLTNGYNPDCFQSRVESSFKFIKYIRSQEEYFSSEINNYDIPMLWHTIAYNYIQRLVIIRKTTEKVASGEWWNKIMRDQLYSEVVKNNNKYIYNN